MEWSEMPDGFVTPLRVTPHRKLASSPPSESAGEKGSIGGNRLAKMPRRHQLRGPFGQMLMEEMAKSDLKQQVPGEGGSPESVSLGSSPVTVSSRISTQSMCTMSPLQPLTTLATGTPIHPLASASSGGLHQRTQSNPVPVRSDFTPVAITITIVILSS